MQLSEQAVKIHGISNAALVMGTKLNKDMLKQQGLLTSEGDLANESDLIIAFSCEPQASETALQKILTVLETPERAQSEFPSVDVALQHLRDAKLACVSIPGAFAKDLVPSLQDQNLHVFLFSDHVPLQDEIRFKQEAHSRGLLMLGPEAGTTIIQGACLGFGNAVRRGPVGIVASAGTGIQEVSVLLHEFGTGVSTALGVGGRDMQDGVDGVMTIDALRYLQRDPETQVIVLISKKADQRTERKVLSYIEKEVSKPCVVCILNEDISTEASHVIAARSLQTAALAALRLLKDEKFNDIFPKLKETIRRQVEWARKIRGKLLPSQRYVRGLFAGGTLCYESMLILSEMTGEVYSNTPIHQNQLLQDPNTSKFHTCIDYGHEEFTEGRAHPILDPTLRMQRLMSEASDEAVAAIILDIEAGYGVPRSTVDRQVEAIMQTHEKAVAGERSLPILVHLCSTLEETPDVRKRVQAAGIQIFDSNAVMAFVASMLCSTSGVPSQAVSEKYMGVKVA